MRKCFKTSMGRLGNVCCPLGANLPLTNLPFWHLVVGQFVFATSLAFSPIVDWVFSWSDTLLAVAWARLVVICHWTLFVGSVACCCCCWPALPPPPPCRWTRWKSFSRVWFYFLPPGRPAFVVKTSLVSTVDSTSLTEKRVHENHWSEHELWRGWPIDHGFENEHVDDLEDEDEDKNLTDAHHAWTWGAVWRGGEGGDLTMWFVNIASIFSTTKNWNTCSIVLTCGIWISCFIWIGFEPFQCWLVLLLGRERDYHIAFIKTNSFYQLGLLALESSNSQT